MTESHFTNIQSVIATHIAHAENFVCVAVAWFTNDSLFNSLTEALRRKVKVKVLILDDLINRNEFGLDFGVLGNAGADVRFANSAQGSMHNKFCIIDDIVITGSYNWTYHANVNNENIIITDEPNVVMSYCEQFNKLFNNGTKISLPYKHLKWTDVKEGDFLELRRNIFRDIIAQNDVNKELKKNKLIELNRAYESGSKEELELASSLPVETRLRTIKDVLISRSQDFALNLWEENIEGKPCNNVDGYIDVGQWYYIPYYLKEDNKSHRKYIEGTLKTKDAKERLILAKGLYLNVYDEEFIATVKKFLGSNELSDSTRKLIPNSLLCIDMAKMFYYRFPYPMFNKSQSKSLMNTELRLISGINILGIVKEFDGDNITFYNGWDPYKRGEKITKEFFVKEL